MVDGRPLFDVTKNEEVIRTSSVWHTQGQCSSVSSVWNTQGQCSSVSSVWHTQSVQIRPVFERKH